MSTMPFDEDWALGRSTSDEEMEMSRITEELKVLAELAGVEVLNVMRSGFGNEVVALVQDRNGEKGAITSYGNWFRSTTKFPGPLAQFTESCGDGIWNYSIRI